MRGVEMRCHACGFDLASSAKFCSECGEPVARRPERAPSEGTIPGPGFESGVLDGERRQLTVLFADLVGSTAIASRLDPEDWRDVASAYQDACSAVAERFEGYVAQYLGDGLVVYFGYPAAHEDDALRSVRAGLGIVEAVSLLEPKLEHLAVKLSVRVGVHTGTVVVGEVGSRKEMLALGDTTNVAARLQAVAAPNTVVMSAATFRLVRRHFVTEEHAAQVFKGISEPVSVYRAVSASRVKSTFGAVRELPANTFVGRAAELVLLRDAWQKARRGEGQVVIVSGEAGIGKSRIAAHLRQEIADAPHSWVESHGSSYTQDTALCPVVTLQEDALGLGGYETPEQKMSQIERSLGRIGLTPAEHLPLFADLHSLPLPARFKPLDLTPEARRHRTLDSLVEWLLRASQEQPLILLLEDLHWIDPTTLELLGRLAQRLGTDGFPILLLLTHRPGFVSPWSELPHVTSLPLGRLGRDDAANLVRGMEVVRGNLEAEVVTEIVDRSDGVPLFLEELTKTVLDARAASDAVRRPEKTSVPVTLQDSLMARLDQLGEAKELVHVCATIGREFSFALLRATVTLDEEKLAVTLEKLVAAKLLQHRGEPRLYSFRHALLQEQAYASLLKTVRQSLHRKIAAALETQFPQLSAREPELLAHHHDAGGSRERALGYWLKAGQKSVARSANVEATRQLLHGLEALAHLPESRERDQQELHLLTLRAVALIAARGYGAGEVEQAFVRARALCQRLGGTPLLFPVLFGHCLFYLVRAELDSANTLAEELQAIATATSDVEYALETHSMKAALRFWEGNFRETKEHLLHARAMFDPIRHQHHMFVYGQDPLAYGYSYGALALWFLGYPEQALLSARRALELAERSNHPHTLVGVLSFSGDLHHHLRQPVPFETFARRTLAVALDQNLPMWVGPARGQLGLARFQVGERAEGLAEIVAGIEAFRKTGAEINAAYFIARLVEALLAAGQLEEGLTRIREALGLMGASLNRYYEAELHRLEGELLRCMSQPDAAEPCFLRAIAVSRAQSAKSLELRATMSLGHLRAAAGRHAEAVELLAPVYEWFTEGLQTPDLLEARSLLSLWRAEAPSRSA